jgi:hypothetical protein
LPAKLAGLGWWRVEITVSQNTYESPINPDNGPLKRMPVWEAMLCGVLVVLIILTLGWTLLSASTEARTWAVYRDLHYEEVGKLQMELIRADAETARKIPN